MKAVEIKYPTVSEANKKNKIKDFAAKISLSKNQMFENLWAALIIKQYPKEQMKVPTKKK